MNKSTQGSMPRTWYATKTPWWLRMMYPSLLWRMPAEDKAVYLTFDDGPHPVATPFVLDLLHQYQARASFFCIGKNVVQYPELYARIRTEGHAIGNHTHNHLNGWKTKTDVYLQDIEEAGRHIKPGLFRPPYGRLRKNQVRVLKQQYPHWKLVMWDVLSGDFDTELEGSGCVQHVSRHSRPGSIIVFHDSEKAWPRLEYALPILLEYFTKKGWACKALI
jgi:peptidoglycan-N-acetylglucosamine deacetylase